MDVFQRPENWRIRNLQDCFATPGKKMKVLKSYMQGNAPKFTRGIKMCDYEDLEIDVNPILKRIVAEEKEEGESVKNK